MSTGPSHDPPGAAPGAPQRVRFRVVACEDGLTLRQLLPRRIRGLTPAAAADLIKAGGAFLGDVRVRVPTVRVAAGERVTVYPAAAAARPLDPLSLRVVHRDPEFIVVDKPAGVPVAAAAAARGTLSAALVALLAREGVARPYVGPVRPPPAGASGLVLCTVRGQDTASAHRLYAEAPLVARARALVAGDPAAELTCDLPVLPCPSGQVRIARLGQRGAAPARTGLRRLAAVDAPGGPAALVDVELVGDAAALVAHAAALGHPVLPLPADPAADPGAEPALHLHLYELVLTHPRGGARVELRVELPPWARRRDDP